MMIHIECAGFAVYCVLWRHYDITTDTTIDPTWRVRLGNRVYKRRKANGWQA
jgi:hypothetical protein